MKIVQISDSHISHLGGVMNENFARLVDFVNNELKPDLVVNTGDVSMLLPDSSEDREAAARLHGGFHAPVRILPGNHDIGEPGEHAWAGISVTTERLAKFKETFGADCFLELVGDRWAIVGLNSELMGSGIPEEEAQWTWLAKVAHQHQGRNVLLFIHKPLWMSLSEITEHQLAIEPDNRDRVLELFAGSTVRAIGSGHLHCYKRARKDGIVTIWAPSSAFVVKEGDNDPDLVKAIANLGLNQPGVVEYRIDGENFEAYFRSIPSVVEASPWEIPVFNETYAWVQATVAK